MKKTFQRNNILHILLMLTLLSGLFCSLFFNEQSHATSIPELQKIQSGTFELADKKDTKYAVWLWTKQLSSEDINKNILANTGYDPALYEDEVAYTNAIVPMVTEKVIKKYGEEKAYEKVEVGVTTKERISRVDLALIEDYDAYIMASRNTLAQMQEEKTAEFIRNNNIDKSDIIYNGKITGTIILYADKEKIEQLSSQKEIIEISPYQTQILTSETYIALDQINADSSNGTGSSIFNSGSGYLGTGIKIGIIEAKGQKYDPTVPQLSGIHNNSLTFIDTVRVKDEYGNPIEVVPSTVGSHATKVTSIIVGQSTTFDGNTYVGVVPNATVYQTTAITDSDLYKAAEMLILNGVSVINLSAGIENDTSTYNSLDKEVDKIVYDSHVTFVTSSGNKYPDVDPITHILLPQHVTSPGKAYNVITVGAARTKIYDTTSSNPPYLMYESSCRTVESYLTNKPDVAAPGTSIRTLKRDSSTGAISVDPGTGTSMASAFVAGVAAQLHQAKTSFKTNPTKTKAAVLVGAHREMIRNDAPRNIYEPYLYDKSGAGFIDSKRSMDTSLSTNMYTYSFDLYSVTNNMYHTTSQFYVPSGKTVRVVLSYEKPEYDWISSSGYGNNLDLLLLKSDGTQVAAASSQYSNVEVLEFTSTEGGYYKIRTKVICHITASVPTNLKATVTWLIF